jgi:hypothetical protein
VKRHQDRGFPNPKVFRSLGLKMRLARRLMEYARLHPDHDDVAALCTPVLPPGGSSGV